MVYRNNILRFQSSYKYIKIVELRAEYVENIDNIM